MHSARAHSTSAIRFRVPSFWTIYPNLALVRRPDRIASEAKPTNSRMIGASDLLLFKWSIRGGTGWRSMSIGRERMIGQIGEYAL